MAARDGQQVVACGVGQHGFDVHGQRALVVEGDGGGVMLGKFDFAFAVQGQGAAGEAQALGDAGCQRTAGSDAAGLQQAGRQRRQQRLFGVGGQAYPGAVRILP
ncbi:hypothetical protein D3C71_1474290 [compost metagenome]